MIDILDNPLIQNFEVPYDSKSIWNIQQTDQKIAISVLRELHHHVQLKAHRLYVPVELSCTLASRGS